MNIEKSVFMALLIAVGSVANGAENQVLVKEGHAYRRYSTYLNTVESNQQSVRGINAEAGGSDYQIQQGLRIGGFWAEQYKRLVVKWLPHCIKQMEKGGRGEELLNLVAAGEVLAGKKPSVKFKGCAWSDAYPYNTIEAASLALEIDPGDDAELKTAQNFLRTKIKEWIPIFLAAQEKSGYIHSFHTLKGRPHFKKYKDHEFYVMGYFIEMGIAHHRATGDRQLIDAAIRCADHLDSIFGPAPKRTWMNGHPGLEYALCRLADHTGDLKYARLAQYFIRNQHSQKEIQNSYNQSERPAVDMKDASGHAVRAAYFYAGMAAVANRLGDDELGGAAARLFDSILNRKYYLTGGIGSRYKGEAFGEDYELPQLAYAESCAGCGLEFFAREMRSRCGAEVTEAVRERAIYNNILGAVSLDGESFYYQNPLSTNKRRTAWHVCPCCVGNIPRTLFALKDTVFSVSSDKLFVNQYMDIEGAKICVKGKDYAISMKTDYPANGKVRIETLAPVTIYARFPNRAESALYIAEPKVSHGYRQVGKEWEMPMPEQTVKAIGKVVSCRGKTAFQRGPIVYSWENGIKIPNYRRMNTGAISSVVWTDDSLSNASFAHSDKAYIFTYFSDKAFGGRSGQAAGMRVAYSLDGKKWTAIADEKPFLVPKVGSQKLMRDPSVCRGPDGIYHAVWTTGWKGRDIGYASSKDLVDWSRQKIIPVMAHEPNARNCWAPEVTWNPDDGLFYIYWSTTMTDNSRVGHRIYLTTTKDWKTFTKARLWFAPSYSVIDAALLRTDGIPGASHKWLMAVKNENRNGKNLRLLWTDNLSEQWRGEGIEIVPAGKGPQVEGPSIIRIGNDIFIYFDCFRDHRYGAVKSTDGGRTWHDISQEVSFPKGIRHGTAIEVPKSILDDIKIK